MTALTKCTRRMRAICVKFLRHLPMVLSSPSRFLLFGKGKNGKDGTKKMSVWVIPIVGAFFGGKAGRYHFEDLRCSNKS